MKIVTTPRFERSYKRLPLDVKKEAEKKTAVFLKDWKDPRLKTHKLKGDLTGLWSFSINQKYRIIFEFSGKDTAHFHTVGGHEIYG